MKKIILRKICFIKKSQSLYTRETHFAPCTGIIGPSMSGKSRTVIEVKKRHPMIYVCLRQKDSTGCPESTIYIRDFLLDPASASSIVENRFLLFFASAMIHFIKYNIDEIKDYIDNKNSPKLLFQEFMKIMYAKGNQKVNNGAGSYVSSG